MIIGWNPRQEALRQQYADFGARVLAPQAADCDARNGFNHLAWQELTEMGIWQPFSQPEPSPESAWDFAALLEGLSSTALDTGFVLSVIAQAAFLRSLQHHASPEQRAALHKRLQAGAIVATAIAEPQSGTDVPGIQTSATATQGGYLIQGEKTNIAHPLSSLVLVAARAPEHGPQSVTAFMVDPHQNNCVADPFDDKMGNRSIPTASLRFWGAFVPEDRVLGGIGNGLKVLGTIGTFARVCYALAGAMLPRPVLRDSLAWVRTRASQGRPLGEHQYVQGRLTEVQVALESARWTALGALHQLLRGDAGAVAACSVAKIQGCRAFREGMEQLLAVQGSLGYRRGDAERLMRDALGWMNVGGTEELHRMLVWNGLNK